MEILLRQIRAYEAALAELRRSGSASAAEILRLTTALQGLQSRLAQARADVSTTSPADTRPASIDLPTKPDTPPGIPGPAVPAPNTPDLDLFRHLPNEDYAPSLKPSSLPGEGGPGGAGGEAGEPGSPGATSVQPVRIEGVVRVRVEGSPGGAGGDGGGGAGGERIIPVRADAPLPVHLDSPPGKAPPGQGVSPQTPAQARAMADMARAQVASYRAQGGKPSPTLTGTLGAVGPGGVRGAKGEPARNASVASFHLAGPLPLPVKGESGGRGPSGAGGSPGGAGGDGGSTGAQIARTQSLVRFEQQRSKYLTSPEGRKALQTELRMQQELARAQASSGYARINAEQGTLAAGASLAEGAMARFQASISGVTSAAQSVWSTGSGAILSLVRAASPVAFDTLQGSITMLAITLGEHLVPYVDMLSLGIQRAAQWYGSLSTATKKWVAWGIASATAIAGIVVVGGKLVGVLGVVATAARIASAALATMGAAAWANPVTAAIGAVGLALGGLATYWALTRDNAQQAGDAMSGATKVNVQAREEKKSEAFMRKDLSAIPEQFKRAIVQSYSEPVKLAEALARYQKVAQAEFAVKQREDFAAEARYDEADRFIGNAVQMTRKQFLRGKEAGMFGQKVHPDAFPLEKSIYTKYRNNDPSGARSEAGKDLAAQIRHVLTTYKIPSDLADTVMRRLNYAPPGKPTYFDEVFGGSGKDKIEGSISLRGISDQKRLDDLDAAAAQVRLSADLSRKAQSAGLVPSTASAAPLSPADELKRSLKSLPQTRIQDSMSYIDSLQVAALNGGDLDADNRAKQLAILEKSGELLQTLVDRATDLQGVLGRPTPFRGGK